uniref:Uncharacterized protein n=1 Tax=Theropithecus gelada TaxID=9565 RepID=A0A8D2FUT3_THEGE
MGFHHVGQAGVELLTSSDLLTLASQNAGIIGVSCRARPQYTLLWTGSVPALDASSYWCLLFFQRISLSFLLLSLGSPGCPIPISLLGAFP